jgi:hypothetical protein
MLAEGGVKCKGKRIKDKRQGVIAPQTHRSESDLYPLHSAPRPLPFTFHPLHFTLYTSYALI